MAASDYGGVGCDGYREALSARLDGEEEPGGPAALDAHLARCPACRRWLDDAAAVTRLVRTAPARAGVDVTGTVLPAAPRRWRGRLVVGLRVALGLFGLAQLMLGLAQVTLLRGSQVGSLHESTIDGATPGHLWHESAAWNVAVGAAFLWVAAQRGRPAAIVPIMTVFVGALVLLSVADMAAGRVELARVASHGFLVIGYLVVLALSRPALDLTPPGNRGRGGRRWWARSRTGPQPAAGPETDGTVVPFPGRDRHRPAVQTRRRAAA